MWGWGDGRDGSRWCFVPKDAPDVMIMYERTYDSTNNVYEVSSVNWGTTIPKLGAVYILNVIWTRGYIPMHLDQPAYFAKLVYWKYQYPAGFVTIGLPTPPFEETYSDLAGCFSWYGWNHLPCYTQGNGERVFAVQYRFGFSGDPLAPTIYSGLFGVAWNYVSGCPYTWDTLNNSLPSPEL